ALRAACAKSILQRLDSLAKAAAMSVTWQAPWGRWVCELNRMVRRRLTRRRIFSKNKWQPFSKAASIFFPRDLQRRLGNAPGHSRRARALRSADRRPDDDSDGWQYLLWHHA